MKGLFKIAAAAAVLSATASMAHAAVYLKQPVKASDGSFTQAFGDTKVLPNKKGVFTSLIKYIVIPVRGIASVSLTTTATSSATNIDFKAADVLGPKGFDQSFTFTPVVKKGTESGETGLFDIKPGKYEISVTGSSGKSAAFAGVFAFSPTPEPATWAMMLLGVAGMGATLRAHRREDRKLRALETVA